MSSKYKDRIERAKKALHEGTKVVQTSYINSYLDVIRQGYLELDEEKRIGLIKGLELLIRGIELNQFPDFSQVHINPLNPKIAKSIRLKAKLTQTALARIVGCKQQFISSIENGSAKIGMPPYEDNSPIANYFNWLKEKGYDPFNL